MKTYVLSVFSVVTLSSIIVMMLPTGKTSKFIKSILSIFVLLVVISPVISFVSGQENLYIPTYNNNENNEIQLEYLSYVYDNKNNYNEINCNSILSKYNIDGQTVIVYCIDNGEYKIKNIKIFLRNLELYTTEKHKVIIENAKIDISKSVNVEKEIITIYERK